MCIRDSYCPSKWSTSLKCPTSLDITRTRLIACSSRRRSSKVFQSSLRTESSPPTGSPSFGDAPPSKKSEKSLSLLSFPLSPPYPTQAGDRRLVLEGLKWFEDESQRRFHSRFAELSPDQQTALCEAISHPATVAPAVSYTHLDVYKRQLGGQKPLW